MKKGKTLLSYLGSLCVFGLFALLVLIPTAKADAASLSVKEINYKDSTITIHTSNNDSILYFSDSKKKKWETVNSGFTGGDCVMDISWVSTTKNYEITFKGDKSEDIISATIPKQVTKFKAKYSQATGLVTFTGTASGDEIEYRKNNTDEWASFTALQESEAKETLLRLCENGASVYFRIAPVNGSSSNAGSRPSKEVACKINKKSAAPTVTIDTATSKITVQSGWQVRKVETETVSGVTYVKGTTLNPWKTYTSEQDVNVFDLAPEAEYRENEQTDTKEVYLQFRKEATSSSQLSYITTIKVPAQEAPPAAEKNVDVKIEYTSTTTFNVSFPKASSSQPYEYCIVSPQDIKNVSNNDFTITDVDSVSWKTASSSSTAELKKTEAPEGSYIYLRKKAIGKTGDDDFKMASPYVHYAEPIAYPSANDTIEDLDEEFYTFDGVCTTNNSAGHIDFNFTTPYNTTIKEIRLSTTPDMEDGEKATVNSTVKKDSSSGKYLVSATISNISLSADQKKELESKTKIKLYAYIVLSSNGTEALSITSNNKKGLRINVAKSSSITKATGSDKTNTLSVTRLIGSKTQTSASSDGQQYESFWFTLETGINNVVGYNGYDADHGYDLENDNVPIAISSVYLGNYELTAPGDYSYDKTTGKFTVNLSNFETNEKLYSSYNTTKQLIISLNSGEKLSDVTVKLVPPVSLNSVYSWAFTANGLEEETTTTTTTGTTTTTTKAKVNSYSAGYSLSSTQVDGVSVSYVTLQSATFTDAVSEKNILFNMETNKIIFSNQLLNALASGSSDSAKLVFKVTYSNGYTGTYTINKGCYFTVM